MRLKLTYPRRAKKPHDAAPQPCARIEYAGNMRVGRRCPLTVKRARGCEGAFDPPRPKVPHQNRRFYAMGEGLCFARF